MAPKSWTPAGSSTTFVAIPTKVRHHSMDSVEIAAELPARTESLRKFSANV